MSALRAELCAEETANGSSPHGAKLVAALRVEREGPERAHELLRAAAEGAQALCVPEQQLGERTAACARRTSAAPTAGKSSAPPLRLATADTAASAAAPRPRRRRRGHRHRRGLAGLAPTLAAGAHAEQLGGVSARRRRPRRRWRGRRPSIRSRCSANGSRAPPRVDRGFFNLVAFGRVETRSQVPDRGAALASRLAPDEAPFATRPAWLQTRLHGGGSPRVARLHPQRRRRCSRASAASARR